MSNEQTTKQQAQETIDQATQVQETTDRFHEGQANSHQISDTSSFLILT